MDSSSESSNDATMLPHGLSTSTQASSSSIASAIANFKPSSREVISGIAPHVFDERRKRRKKSLRSIRNLRYSADKGTSSSSSSSSPLRCSAVIAWDNGSMILLDTEHHTKVKESNVVNSDPTPAQPSLYNLEPPKQMSAWRNTLFRTIVIKLRPSKRRKL